MGVEILGRPIRTTNGRGPRPGRTTRRAFEPTRRQGTYEPRPCGKHHQQPAQPARFCDGRRGALHLRGGNRHGRARGGLATGIRAPPGNQAVTPSGAVDNQAQNHGRDGQAWRRNDALQHHAATRTAGGPQLHGPGKHRGRRPNHLQDHPPGDGRSTPIHHHSTSGGSGPGRNLHTAPGV